jgi:hypothetical protein
MMVLLLLLVAIAVAVLVVHRSALRAYFDAKDGVNTVELYVTERVGDVPAWDPADNLEHARVTQALQSVDVEQLQQQLARVEDELALHESLLALNAKLVGCAVGEVLGCTLLFKSLGFSGVERIVPAVLFAFFLFWVTSETKRQTRLTWRVLLIVVYVVLMFAVTALRVLQASADGRSWIEDLAVGVVMLAVSTGGAWLAEALNARRVPSLRLGKEQRNVRRRLRKAEERRRAAQAFTDRFARHRERVSRQRAVVAAAYNAAHFRATAQLERRTPPGGPAWSA